MNTSKNKSHGILIYCVLAITLVIIALLLWKLYDKFVTANTETAPTQTVHSIILDAGHGGYDGGAVSVTGTPEKELNLKTTLKLAEIMKAQGYNVILTRDSDTELTVPGSNQSRKMQDIKGRLDISEANQGVPFVSIHMNKFPQSKYSGVQIYYAKGNDNSINIAKAVQSRVKNSVQPDNNREIKSATSAIYLLYHMKSPAILIECGFLSNENEAKLLEQDEYRTKLCLSLYAGLADSQI